MIRLFRVRFPRKIVIDVDKLFFDNSFTNVKKCVFFRRTFLYTKIKDKTDHKKKKQEAYFKIKVKLASRYRQSGINEFIYA